MSRTCTEPVRHALNGPTMGTRWSALFFAAPGFDPAPVRSALQAAVDEVDGQMSTWKPDSDLMRLNAAPPGVWVDLPPALVQVLAKGLAIGRASDGAFARAPRSPRTRHRTRGSAARRACAPAPRPS